MDVKKHRFTVEEYHLMGEAGIFGEDDRVELVGGEVVEMTPIGWRHLQAVNEIARKLNRWIVFEAGTRGIPAAVVSVQNPLIVDEDDERQPDLVLLREQVKGRVPDARDALLVVEVSDISLRYDREDKLPLYARAGIPEVWIVNLPEERIEIYTRPEPDGYADALHARGDEELPSPSVKGIRASRILA